MPSLARPATTLATRLCVALAICAPAVHADPPHPVGDDDLRDTVVLKGGKELRGRVIERYREDGDGRQVVMRVGGKRKVLDHAEIASMETVRDRLRTWLGERKPGLNVDQKWFLVERAKQLQLPRMAHLQALSVVLDHPDHLAARDFLGHRKRGKDWQWTLDGKRYSKEDLGERIQDWSTRLVLESEHYSLETDAGFRAAVRLLMDLEHLYLYWMDTFGEAVRAGETVDEPNIERMTWQVHRERSSYKDSPSQLLEPYYDPSRQTSAGNGSSNLAMTYFWRAEDFKELSTPRPTEFVSVAVQQLLYSLLLMSRTVGGPPPDAITRHSHWLEVGFGYWMLRQWGGETGYPEVVPFEIEPRVAGAITTRATKKSPLTKVKRDIVNVVGLEAKLFYGTTRDAPLHRDKARGLFAFLMEQPLAARSETEPLLGATRRALLDHVGQVYLVPKAHSSRELDRSLAASIGAKKAKIERLYRPWREWGAAEAAR
jgi:hypothetical protein